MTALEQTPSGFVTVARTGDVEPGTVRVIEVDGRSLCLGLTEDGEWGAIDNVCTHDGGTLGEGELDETGGRVPAPRRPLRPLQRPRPGPAGRASGDRLRDHRRRRRGPGAAGLMR